MTTTINYGYKQDMYVLRSIKNKSTLLHQHITNKRTQSLNALQAESSKLQNLAVNWVKFCISLSQNV